MRAVWSRTSGHGGRRRAGPAGVVEPEVEPGLLEVVRAEQEHRRRGDARADGDAAHPDGNQRRGARGQRGRRAEREERERRQAHVLRLDEVHGEHEEGEARERRAPARPPDRQAHPREEQARGPGARWSPPYSTTRLWASA